MVKMFFGEKLQSLRELSGLSRKELAEKVGVTEQAVWQYENQYTNPKFETINELKKLFSVKVKYFYTEPVVPSVAKIESIAYRSQDRDSRKKAKMETTFIDFVNHLISQFERHLNLPPSSIVSLRNNCMEIYHTEPSHEISNTLIEQIATYARERLTVNHNRELMYKLEMSGVYILEKDMGHTIDAYSTWTEENRPFIILGSIKKSSVRRNFDLAHELAHLLLHYKIDMDSLTKDEYNEIEREANTFASYFLLPKEEFLKDFSEIKKISNPKSYIDLKQKYMVSIAALEYRAYKLGLLTYEENRYFYNALNRYDFRTKEPLDEEIAIIKPGKVRALLEVVFENGLMNMNDFLNENYIEVTFVESVLGIGRGFLAKYNIENKRHYFNQASVVSFPKK